MAKENNYLGMVFIMFVAALVGLTFIGLVADQVTQQTQTATVTNQPFTFPQNQSTITLTGQAAYNVVVINASSGATYGSTNYTVTNYVGASTGTPTVTLKGLSTVLNGTAVNLSYTYEPQGFIVDNSARSITTLIVIFFAIALLVVIMVPMFREKLFEQFGI